MTDSTVQDQDEALEPIPSEVEDLEAPLRHFEIVTYPADYTLGVLVDKYRRGQVVIPPFQRGYVWKQTQASRLIESFLLGLPVPALFLFADRANQNRQLVVDGQQRLRTITYFFDGYFGEASPAGRRQVFRLTGLHETSPYLGMTASDLENEAPAAWNKLNDAVLRAFIIQQLNPQDDSSVYQIFERLNTGGTQLNPQEIRNAVDHGPFNELLQSVNRLPTWRKIFGSPNPDKRQRDIELLLRCLALADDLDVYEKPMKDFLNRYMARNRNLDTARLEAIRSRLSSALQIASELGERPFRRGAGLNAAMFDGVMTAILRRGGEAAQPPSDLRDRYNRLVASDEYEENVSRSTTDADVVQARVAAASRILFG